MKKKTNDVIVQNGGNCDFLATNCWKVHSKVHSNCD